MAIMTVPRMVPRPHRFLVGLPKSTSGTSGIRPAQREDPLAATEAFLLGCVSTKIVPSEKGAFIYDIGEAVHVVRMRNNTGLEEASFLYQILEFVFNERVKDTSEAMNTLLYGDKSFLKNQACLALMTSWSGVLSVLGGDVSYSLSQLPWACGSCVRQEAAHIVSQLGLLTPEGVLQKAFARGNPPEMRRGALHFLRILHGF